MFCKLFFGETGECEETANGIRSSSSSAELNAKKTRASMATKKAAEKSAPAPVAKMTKTLIVNTMAEKLAEEC